MTPATRTTLTDVLATLAADHTVLYQKARSYHWNVRGPQFFVLHAQFQALYERLATSIDDLAERVVALGGRPAATLADCIERSNLAEDGSTPEAPAMARTLVGDLETVTESLREAIRLAEEDGDRTTVNVCDDIADAHAKTAWMLRAFLGS